MGDRGPNGPRKVRTPQGGVLGNTQEERSSERATETSNRPKRARVKR